MKKIIKIAMQLGKKQRQQEIAAMSYWTDLLTDWLADCMFLHAKLDREICGRCAYGLGRVFPAESLICRECEDYNLFRVYFKWKIRGV